MKKNHLIASAVAATCLFCSTASHAGGLVGGFGAGLGGALNGGLGSNMGSMGGMGSLGGSMNGAGAFNASSDGLGRVNRAVSHGTQSAGKDAGKAAGATKSDASQAKDKTQGAATGTQALASATAGAASNIQGAAGGDLVANASHTSADNPTATKTNTPSPAPQPQPSTRGSESLVGGFDASRSGVDAGAANEGGVSHGDSSATHSAAASASVSR